MKTSSGALRFLFTRRKLHFGGPAIFLDRDGVINRRKPGGYILHASQFAFVPGIQSALKKLSTLELPMIVISNQAAVGKGLLKPSVLRALTMQFHQRLHLYGVNLYAAYYCPHRVEENCPCRKPKPGMLFQARDDFRIELSRSIFIGDSYSDALAALAAGCQPLLFGSGLGEPTGPTKSKHNVLTSPTAKDLFPVVMEGLKKGGSLDPRG